MSIANKLKDQLTEHLTADLFLEAAYDMGYAEGKAASPSGVIAAITALDNWVAACDQELAIQNIAKRSSNTEARDEKRCKNHASYVVNGKKLCRAHAHAVCFDLIYCEGVKGNAQDI